MQRGFTKLFNTIVTSTIWQEPDATRIVWITMLAICDQHGVVSASLPGLASVSNITLERCAEAVKALESPDEYSRTKDFEGRRIQQIDGGWVVLNYVKYRAMLSQEERKEYKAKWAREHRRQKRGQMLTNVDSVDEQGRLKTLPSASASASLSESEWVLGLCTDPAYTGIDVKRELAKAQRWYKEHKKQFTRRKFLGWLNRQDKQLLPIEPAPSKYFYQDRPYRDPTPDELSKMKEIAKSEIAKLKARP